MRTIKLTLAYDGTDYVGWQRQDSGRSVQAALEATIEKITGQHSSTLASGRTDAGVHALGQVVSFRTPSRLPPDVLRRALNAELPRNLAVLDVTEVHDSFHATHDALRKRYRYVIHDGPVRDVFALRYAWHFTPGRLDAAAMQRAAAALLGTHDFSSFETTGAPRKTSVRTVYELSIQRGRAGQGTVPMKTGTGSATTCTVTRSKPLLVAVPVPVFMAFSPAQEGTVPISAGPSDFITLEIEANGFLYNMVRAIVGTLVDVGRGTRSETWPGEVLAAADRRRAGRTAPPQGLFLVGVQYPEVDL
jgi:tRNA pseudouridine38-40 synthase